MNQKSSAGMGNEGVVEQAKQVASTFASRAKEGASHQLDTRKEKAVETIHNVSSVIRDAGGKLKDAGPLPVLAERAASGIDRAAEFFESRDVGDMIYGVERFARREPALFLGAAVALGVLAGRFLKSSASRGASGEEEGFEGSELEGRRFGYARRGYEREDIYGDSGYGYEGEYGAGGAGAYEDEELLADDDLEPGWSDTPRDLGEDRGFGGGGTDPGIGSALGDPARKP